MNLRLEPLSSRRARAVLVLFPSVSSSNCCVGRSERQFADFAVHSARAQYFDVIESWTESARGAVICANSTSITGESSSIRRCSTKTTNGEGSFITLNMTKVVHHLWEAIRFENALTLEPVFDTERPIRSTGDVLPWYSGKPCEHTKRSHINMCVYDSRWEANESLELDRNQNVRRLGEERPHWF
jgi:hypothetical protein